MDGMLAMQLWVVAGGLLAAVMLGAGLGFLVRNLSHRSQDTLLGYAAGVMLAAAVLGLLQPAVGMASDWRLAAVAAAVPCGAWFVGLMDKLTPHMHRITGLAPDAHIGDVRLGRMMLFVMAIALHKLPEGIATGVGFGPGAGDAAWTMAAGIAIQNVPEAMVVISPLVLSGVSRLRTLAISAGIGLIEVAGVWIGYFFGQLSSLFLPVMLAFAGGAMLYVVSDEMLPETHAHGFQKQATYALLLGFLTLLLVDKLFALS